MGPQLQVNLPEPMCSGRAFVFQDSTCLCQARPKMCGSMPSEAKACCHTSRPRAWHRHVDPPSPPHFLFRDRCTHKKLLSQKVPVLVVQVPLAISATFLTCLSRAHSPPSGTGFSAYKAFPAPAATCPRLAASPSRGFYRPAARGRMQTFTAPRAPPAGEIVRLVHICTQTCTHLYARL